MTKTNNHNSKIVIIGPKTSIGQCILDQLAQLNISVTLIRPLDIHQEAGKVVYYANHRLITQPLDTFDFNTKHIIFVCDKKIIPLLCRRKRSNMNWWIDCTHSVHQAQCIIPSINGAILKKKHPKWICNPGSSVIALVQILVPILKAFEIQSIQLMMIMGTFFDNPQSSEKLIVQSRHFLTQTPFPEKYHFPQLAFNLIPDYFNELGSIIQRQLACFIKPYVYVHTCFAPVVRGCCLLVQLNLRKNYHTSRL